MSLHLAAVLRKLVLLGVVTVLASGCAMQKHFKSDSPKQLAELENISRKQLKDAKQAELNKIRLDALRDIAMSLGARSGLAWRVGQINESLKGKAEYLNQVFNFNALIMEENVLPPVLVESRGAMNIETPSSIRLADTNYRIVKQARFISTPPVWRDYLIMKAITPEQPDPSLLPKTREERRVWKEYTRYGWGKGVQQANRIYSENLSRLKRDYQGMIRYRTLLAQNMVSPPQVAKRDLGITGGGDELAVNDRVFTIKALPALKADSKQWHPKVTH